MLPCCKHGVGNQIGSLSYLLWIAARRSQNHQTLPREVVTNGHAGCISYRDTDVLTGCVRMKGLRRKCRSTCLTHNETPVIQKKKAEYSVSATKRVNRHTNAARTINHRGGRAP